MNWRVAAAVALLAGGASSVVLLRRDRAAVPDSVRVDVAAPSKVDASASASRVIACSAVSDGPRSLSRADSEGLVIAGGSYDKRAR